jgi:uncharacterized protein
VWEKLSQPTKESIFIFIFCHGGVIRLPFIGGILSPERKFFPRYTKGIYELNAEQGLAKLAVTAGLGKFRLNNPSEIMICTLERQE